MNKHRSEPQYLTIALSGAPPVRIETARWPIIASAKRSFDDHGWSLVARRHEDCRAIVYGQEVWAWSCDPEYWESSSGPEYFGPEAGELVPKMESMEEQDRLIARKITKVGKALGFADYFIQRCIRRMAPLELD